MNSFLQNLSHQMPDYAWNLCVIAFSILIGVIVKYLVVPVIKKLTAKELPYSVFRSSIRHFKSILIYFIPILVFNTLFPLMHLEKGTRFVINRILEISIILCFTIILIKVVRVVEDYLYHLFDYNKIDNLKERKLRTQIQFIRKFVISLIIILAGSAILLNFESMRKIGAGLLTGVGIGGIIIGFAAQKSLGNLLAGFQIAFTQPIRIDDVVIVEGEWGKVEDITLTYVVVNIWDKRRLILPITYFIEKPFQNWTRTTAEILGTVFIYTDYTLPVAAVRAEHSRLLRTNALWDGKVDVVQVTDFTETSMQIRCLMSCRNSGDAFDLRCYIREHLITYIQNNYPESLSRTRISLETNKPEGFIP
ncbi:MULTISPECIES: mechanosensitive ion channel family protein [unclassified Siphonobacter]|uniref:mechanosensitive ion channel family protein n=1 Tax=unclassified Siphonobacter TaxID=2635712 RepID=UPI000CB93202|nr:MULTISPECIES: mechanosensitive ion channel family protein [unclassified Siphonobacter]MDQ1087736.1 small-conductance mechanosensitive channel [Siphonobacter sp. SORGH_AS_1065]MDR6193882.1 small-conductance mechanosensitive channel [Siphonobacter sp. SORGH_AS_0500]PKK34796.1 mechanosensitive ion channel protein MscS [Siphonobacter sp. SORGH_AS_0500]